ncbi:MAG: hypothetical protein HQL63_05455 [Magnetococcales bacterium]|nr:hypothetical protein [Magnetococcales bacterium]
MNTLRLAPILSATIPRASRPGSAWIHTGLPDLVPQPAGHADKTRLQIVMVGMVFLVLQSGAANSGSNQGDEPRTTVHPLSLGYTLQMALRAAIDTGINPESPAHFARLTEVKGTRSQALDLEEQADRRDQARLLLEKPFAAAKRVVRDDAKQYLLAKGRSLPIVESLGKTLESLGVDMIPFGNDDRQTHLNQQTHLTGGHSLVKLGWNPLQPAHLRIHLQRADGDHPASASSWPHGLYVDGHIAPGENQWEGGWRSGHFNLSGVVRSGRSDGETMQVRAGYQLSEHATAELRSGNQGAALTIHFSRSF